MLLDAEPPLALDKFMEASGLSAATLWRYRRAGWLTTINIAGRYVPRPKAASLSHRSGVGSAEEARSRGPVLLPESAKLVVRGSQWRQALSGFRRGQPGCRNRRITAPVFRKLFIPDRANHKRRPSRRGQLSRSPGSCSDPRSRLFHFQLCRRKSQGAKPPSLAPGTSKVHRVKNVEPLGNSVKVVILSAESGKDEEVRLAFNPVHRQLLVTKGAVPPTRMLESSPDQKAEKETATENHGYPSRRPPNRPLQVKDPKNRTRSMTWRRHVEPARSPISTFNLPKVGFTR
jgi:hypothetical protein